MSPLTWNTTSFGSLTLPNVTSSTQAGSHNASIIAGVSGKTTHYHLSRQPAFWGLVPIAVNTMLQPSGRILGLPSSINVVIRSSPFICATSVLHSFWKFRRCLWRNDSMTSAIESFAADRFDDWAEGDAGSLNSLRHNRTFQILFFVLGVLPQALKIYCSAGILPTQVVATLYLACYMCNFVLLAFAGHPSTTRSVKVEEDVFGVGNRYSLPQPTTLQCLSLHIAHRLCCSLVAYSSLSSLRQDRVFLGAGGLAVLSLLAHNTFVILSTFVFQVLGVCCMVWVVCAHAIQDKWIVYTSHYTLVALLILPAFWTRIRKIVDDEDEYVVLFSRSGFVLCHLFTATFYYATLYRPGMTVQPAWTTMLE